MVNIAWGKSLTEDYSYDYSLDEYDDSYDDSYDEDLENSLEKAIKTFDDDDLTEEKKELLDFLYVGDNHPTLVLCFIN